MNEQEKKAYLEKYKKQKEKGVPFFPDIIFKDAVASFIVFLVLVALAYFVGAPVEARANPADTSYTPVRNGISFFQMLKYFPGNLESSAQWCCRHLRFASGASCFSIESNATLSNRVLASMRSLLSWVSEP
jgi:hypothetical protein